MRTRDFNYASMKEIGMLFGRTSHQVGRVLKMLGWRTADGKPSQVAFGRGLVKQRFAEFREDRYLWVWDLKRTISALEALGWRLLPVAAP